MRPLLNEVFEILPGNPSERHASLQRLEENMRLNQGLVLRQEDKVLAMLLYYLKGSSCRISFAYALERLNPIFLLHHLLLGLISLAEADANINTIRCDVVPWFPPSVSQAFESAGFAKAERMLMRRSGGFPASVSPFPDGIKLIPWEPWLNTPAANILHLVFGQSYESKWDRDLAEIRGCKQFLTDCYSGRFGIFDPSVSFALQQDNLWVGLALASWSSEGEGFIPAFGLLPNFVGRGLGSTMLSHLLMRFGKSTFPPSAIELAVSEENRSAVQLYHKFHFQINSRFRVYYRHIG